MRFVDDALKILDRIDQTLNFFSIESASNRSICAGALYSLTLDHARSICNLIKIKAPASAFALNRVMFEAYIRGAWVHYCASDNQVDIFASDSGIKESLSSRKDIDFENLVLQVEQATGSPAYLSEIKTRSWKALNGYTHNGIQQISRYINNKVLRPNFSEDEEREAIEFLLILSCFALGGMMSLCNKQNDVVIVDEVIQIALDWKRNHRPNIES